MARRIRDEGSQFAQKSTSSLRLLQYSQTRKILTILAKKLGSEVETGVFVPGRE